MCSLNCDQVCTGLQRPNIFILCVFLIGVVYMKNTVVQYWDELARSRNKNAFVINDRDKQLVRDNVIQAVLSSSNLIRLAHHNNTNYWRSNHCGLHNY